MSVGPATVPRMANEVVYLTTNEVADLYRVDSSTVRRWADQGRIPAARTPGGQWRFRLSDIEALVSTERPS